MSDTTSDFVKELVAAAPVLQSLYRQHLEDYDELLPHVFMGEVTRFVSTAASGASMRHKDWDEARQVIGFLEAALAKASPLVEDLIAASFVENLEPDEPGFEQVVSSFGSRLHGVLARMRSG